MAKVAILTEQQKDSLANVQFATDMFFYPHQDSDGNWVLHEDEINSCTNPDFQWVKDLSLVDYKPLIINPFE